jgi:hypothetical protein
MQREISLISGEETIIDAPVDAVPVTKEQQESLRRITYITEADPLFFKWQAGEATEEEWLAKRQEIRDRYPYPAE